MLNHPLPDITADTQDALPSAPCLIQPYTPKAIPAILDLTRTALGNSGAVQKTEAFWRWKHQANPFGPSCGLYAWDEAAQTMAGLRVLMRWRFQDRAGQSFRAVRAVDTATHPAYRRQGLFATLTRRAIDDLTGQGVHFIFNTPNQYSLPGYLKMGWQVVARWPVFVKPLRPGRMLARRLGLTTTPPLSEQFNNYFGAEVLPWPAFVEQYGDEINGVVTRWESRRNRVGFRTSRTLDYLQWRYGQHPHLTYGVYPLPDPAELAGFVILRPNLRYGWQELVLTELYLARPDRRLARQLFKEATRQLKGDYLVAHFAPGTLERSLLKQAGFIRVPGQGLLFAARPLNIAPAELFSPSAWDLTLGDLELF